MPSWLEDGHGRTEAPGGNSVSRGSSSARRHSNDHVSTRRSGSFANSGAAAGVGVGRSASGVGVGRFASSRSKGAGERGASAAACHQRGFSNGWAHSSHDAFGGGGNRFAHDAFGNANDRFDQDEEQGEERARSRQEKPSALSRILRGRKSRKADRQFDRAYGQAERASAEPVSRAAVYEMRMGSTHKRATQMQRDASQGTGRASTRRRTSQGASNLRNRLVACVAVLVFAVVMVYQPVANFYNETRSLQQLQAEYALLTEHNQKEQASLDYLSTPEGLEEYAHSELGWVRPDEHVVAVDGIEQPQEQQQERVVTAVQQGSVDTPDTWYSPVLDVVFGYQG